MKLNNWLVFSIGMLLSSSVFSQIHVGGEEEVVKTETKTKSKEKIKIDKQVDTTAYSMDVFIGAGVFSTFRQLRPNSNDLFGRPVGERANEQAMVKPSFNIGIRKKLNSFLQLEASVSFFQSGNRYTFSEADTLHSYSVNYNEIGVGLKLFYYKSINKVDILVGLGAMPSFQMKYKRDETFKNSEGKESTSSGKSKEGINNIGVNVLGNIGVQYNFHPRVGAFAMFEMRYNLANLYQKYEPYRQNNYGIGAVVGLTFKL